MASMSYFTTFQEPDEFFMGQFFQGNATFLEPSYWDEDPGLFLAPVEPSVALLSLPGEAGSRYNPIVVYETSGFIDLVNE
jgi:hypothetical protein